MPTDHDLTLAELASLADVPPRTIRYYVAQGLLPSPDGAGPATRYPAATLARLRLVKQLQRQHLPLAEIRRRLAALTDEEAIALATAPDTAPPGSALDYVQALLAPEPARRPARSVQPRFLREALAGADYLRLPTGDIPPPAALAPSSASTPPPPSPLVPTGATTPSPAGPGRSQWERIVLEPDVELHVRRPLSRIANKRVDRLVTFARQLLEEDKP